MEFEYSPHHSPTNSLHLLSPSHAHAGIEGFATIRQLRRSLSRSPSKPQRFHILTTRACASDPTIPASPSLLGRNSGIEDGVARTRSTIRRAIQPRSSTRRISPNSPLRRALSDNTNQATLASRFTRRTSSDNEQENMDCQEDNRKVVEPRFDEPIKFDFAKTRPDILLQPVFNAPPKSSPLKRSDGVMNLETASSMSPRAKRRSIHGSTSSTDFNVFDQGMDGASSPARGDDTVRNFDGAQSMPYAGANSPHRRPFSLRKSTLQQRNVPGRTRLFGDALADGHSSPALTRARSRISLDSALPARAPDTESPFRRNSADNPPVTFAQPTSRLYQSCPKPHPLSNTLTPSSSNSSMAEDTATTKQPVPKLGASVKEAPPHLPNVFSRSLPIGSLRPSPSADSDSSYATPNAFKMAKPLPQAFMSTGLISKRNRNVESPSAFAAGPMPDTPSKKSHAHILPISRGVGAFSIPPPPSTEFGTPSTPFHYRVSDYSPETYRNGNIFGVPAPDLNRKSSFLSSNEDEQGLSPSHGRDGHSSADDLPPTPTKSGHSQPRPRSKGKSNSLRSSLFGRRASLHADTFISPACENAVPEKETTRELPPSFVITTDVNPSAFDTTSKYPSPQRKSPHTPSGHSPSPDVGKLSVSADRSPALFPSNSFPPATPTGPRDQPFRASMGQSLASSGYFANDVDTSLTSRFSHVTTFGIGEFSQVYKVQGRIQSADDATPPLAIHSVWAVKKSRKPYIGMRDRQRKMQEVHILQQLRGNEHVVEFVEYWESKNHLYIQTEFCENGNLKDFLASTGFKGRLDDFRIWKILLELGQGVKSIHDSNIIHLDIKPANVFIDWEGVLKIGDFGLATAWPAPSGTDGEGDREYIGPEVLSGRFDKPADIFSLGMVMLEIAGNIVLPDNGKSWQRLRAGDMSDLPSLTWSSDSSLTRDESGEPVESMKDLSHDSLCLSTPAEDDLGFLRNTAPITQRSQELVTPPNFMIDAHDPEALDKVVQWMICPDPEKRPAVDALLAAGGVQWVQHRRRAGATVYEGNWGPADEVLDHGQDVEMVDI